MANLLTHERMKFLMDKMGTSFEGTTYAKYDGSKDYALFDDLSAKKLPNASGEFCFVSSGEIDNYNDADNTYGVVAVYFAEDKKKINYALISPAKLRATNAQYFGGTPLYVGTKRVNQAICKVGGGTQDGTRHIRQTGRGYQKDHVIGRWRYE